MLSGLRELNLVSLMLRVLLAMLLGGYIGLERERHGRAAGFRTYMLVALGAAMTVILSQYLNLMLQGPWAETAERLGAKTDVSRFGAQVINGVGFLGAGTVIVTNRQEVKGLTTAAGLWASACMGLVLGAGFYECAIVGFLLIAVCMELLPYVETIILSAARNMNIHIEAYTVECVSNVIGRMKKRGMEIYSVDIERIQQEGVSLVSAYIQLRLPRRTNHAKVLALISAVSGLHSIEEM